MASKHFDLDLDTSLGSSNASHNIIPSQKAIKTYVDNVEDSLQSSIETLSEEVESTYLKQSDALVVTFRDWGEE